MGDYGLGGFGVSEVRLQNRRARSMCSAQGKSWSAGCQARMLALLLTKGSLTILSRAGAELYGLAWG